MSNEIEVGQMLDDRFQIASLITRSGMATLYRGTDKLTGKEVAVKVPFMQYESDPAFFQRFQREEEIGRRLSHPYILHIVPVEKKSRPYIAMEFLEGETLGQLLRKQKRLPVDKALKIASQIAEALAYMHDPAVNVVHRDLKPDNVMLCNDGTIRIMDFGIAKSGLRRITFAGFSNTMGTPDYMAPEQVKGQRGDPQTDIYSLGAILYEMATGSVPFPGDNPYVIMNARLEGDPVAPRTINPSVPPEVEELILHAMERQPTDRFHGVIEMKAELDNPAAVKVEGRCHRLEAPQAWRLQWRSMRAVVLAIIVPIIAIIVFLIIFWKPHS